MGENVPEGGAMFTLRFAEVRWWRADSEKAAG